MEHAAVKDYVKIPKQEYNLLKEVYRTVKRQAFLVRLDESERNLAAGKTKSMTMQTLNLMHSSKVRISHFCVCKYLNSLTANFQKGPFGDF